MQWRTSRSGWFSVTTVSGSRQARKARPRATTKTRAEDDFGADRGGERAEHRPEQRPRDRRPQRAADHLAAFVLGVAVDQPGERAGPDQRAGDALDEPRPVERPGRLEEAEEQRGDGEDEEPADHRAARAEAAGDVAAGEREGEGPGGVGGGEDPGLRGAQTEVVLVGREQRRDGREEGEVEEDHRRGEQEDATHGTIQSAPGGMAERLNAAALKAVGRLRRLLGSNPSPSVSGDVGAPGCVLGRSARVTHGLCAPLDLCLG